VVRILLGDHEAAIGLLEELLTMDYAEALTVADLRLDPTYDPLRGNPRFLALIDRSAEAVEH